MKKTGKLLILLMVATATSCGLKPIPSEYQLINTKKENISLSGLGEGKVLIYNDANILHTSDNTSRLNLKLDGKSLGQLKAKEFLLINIEKGEHSFNIQHLDVVNMRSDHKTEITDATKVIRVKPTISSNKLEATNQLPENWDKYENSMSN